jgi:hypothetical protein
MNYSGSLVTQLNKINWAHEFGWFVLLTLKAFEDRQARGVWTRPVVTSRAYMRFIIKTFCAMLWWMVGTPAEWRGGRVIKDLPFSPTFQRLAQPSQYLAFTYFGLTIYSGKYVVVCIIIPFLIYWVRGVTLGVKFVAGESWWCGRGQ